MSKKIAIIGGGAAGFFAAVNIKKNSPTANVTIYESTNKLLTKVLISGGGRCNVTNNTFDINELVKNYPRGKKELKSVFTSFATKDTVDWFEGHGVKLKTEEDSRMFPITNSSETITKCLINLAKKYAVEIKTKYKAQRISYTKNKYQITFANEEKVEADALILTTGSSRGGYEFSKALGHTIVKPVPSLFTFEIKDPKINNLSGISFKNIDLQLVINKKYKYKQSGPALITHWGLSGPAIIKLSAFGARDLFESNYLANLTINFLPEFNTESLYKELIKQKQSHPNKVTKNDSFLELTKRFWHQIVEISESKDKQTWAEFTNKQLREISENLCNSKFEVQGKGIFKEEFVTAGGVNLKEVDFKTMQSKISPNLYFSGEILNIDALTGGFNFQSAWSTAWVIAKGITNA